MDVQNCTTSIKTVQGTYSMNLLQLSWDDLRIFLAVARSGNLSRASKQLGIDHTTVGRRISALEFALGTPIFERDRSGYRLNSHGRTMLDHVEAVEANVMAMGDAVTSGNPGPAARVRIATMEGIATLYLCERLVQLRVEHPGIVVELVTSSNDVRTSQREADIFLGFFEPRGDNLTVKRLGQFSLHLYAHPAYLAGAGHPASIAALGEHKFVGYIDDLIRLDAVRWLDEVVLRPQFDFYSNSMLAQMFAAAAGAGIVMLPSFARAERFGLVKILDTEVDVMRSVWMSYHQYLNQVPRIRSVVKFLDEIFARDYPMKT